MLAGAQEELLDSYEAKRMPAIHQLDISYRNGPLAVDDRAEPGQLRAGDRAPGGALDDGGRLFDVFRGPDFTLLAFGGATGSFPVTG